MKHFHLLVFCITAIAVRNSSSKCSKCPHNMQQIKEARLKVIQKEILDKLGLPHPPNITSQNILKLQPVKELIESEKLNMDANPEEFHEDNYHAKTHKIILFPETAPKLIADQVEKCCYFTFTGKAHGHGLRVHKASLQVYVKREPNTGKTNATRDLKTSINVFQRGFPVIDGAPQKILVASKTINTNKNEAWYIFNIRSLVKSWRKKPKMNLGIDLEIEGDDSYRLVHGNSIAYQPFLEVHTKNRKRRRLKRRAGLECGFGRMEKRCCRQSLMVDFVTLGWDWIIAPKRFTAYYCTGECEDMVLPMHAHAHLMATVRGNNRSDFCCTPSKMSAISMLYFDLKNRIVLEEVPAMIADTCGCL
ncbi:growth/differentiation factor 8-like [Actinia tenebrosa]|uniref:Growth/differentiation factor 8-like n=1 Tax=Actinia tenebrosa TaxID=6105 RepID=A0A6P8HQX7_ACTTE|nr:growth/differentiation factor 8-like [Actinia tenebrosa]